MRTDHYNTSIALREFLGRFSPVEFGPSPVKRRRAFLVRRGDAQALGASEWRQRACDPGRTNMEQSGMQPPRLCVTFVRRAFFLDALGRRLDLV